MTTPKGSAKPMMAKKAMPKKPAMPFAKGKGAKKAVPKGFVPFAKKGAAGKGKGK